ncbi:alpha/beta fold hydrolase [Rhizobium sp. R693]|uniref:alpha/beta fold hydrolase n=1 Tax=Rhizobium sp. R693 TaxID=1764276 RepID=UPI001FDA437A|nr:alpha/beta fold hydrolase [Rhizobium sp. R693]
MRLSVIVIMLLALVGCGGPRAVLGLPVTSSSGSEPRAIVPIYVATTRARSDNLSLPYSAERSQTLNFAKLDIGIPRNHVPGRIETSGRIPDPSRHFSARTYQPIADRQEFIRQLNAALAQRAPEDREIFIFVHGYNNNFADSVFRNAQITYDYNIKSVSLNYAWPSGASIPLYVFDRDSALIGRRGLAETIEIAAQTNAKRIILVGHSMGAYVVTEALRDLALRGRTTTLKRLGGVVLAAPDIDVDVFVSQLDDIGDIPRPFTIIVSQRDRALGFFPAPGRRPPTCRQRLRSRRPSEERDRGHRCLQHRWRSPQRLCEFTNTDGNRQQRRPDAQRGERGPGTCRPDNARRRRIGHRGCRIPCDLSPEPHSEWARAGFRRAVVEMPERKRPDWISSYRYNI